MVAYKRQERGEQKSKRIEGKRKERKKHKTESV